MDNCNSGNPCRVGCRLSLPKGCQKRGCLIYYVGDYLFFRYEEGGTSRVSLFEHYLPIGPSRPRRYQRIGEVLLGAPVALEDFERADRTLAEQHQQHDKERPSLLLRLIHRLRGAEARPDA